MKAIRYTDARYAVRLRQLTTASSLFEPVVEQRAREIVEAVRQDGDAALLKFTRRFDGARLKSGRLAVSPAELARAAAEVGPALRAAVAEADQNIAGFSRKSARREWAARNSHGARVGEKFDPFRRVGVYVPGGKAPLMSTALMTITLARVAGCPEIVVCTPCGRDGTVNPALLYAAQVAGATEIYRVGGAQAIAALALGTRTIRRVQKIFGPGNAYVVAAKRLLVGHVAIDLLPGPSELLVLADDTADARYVAADLLAQAEHGSGQERVWLVTPSKRLLDRVQDEIERQWPVQARRHYIESVLRDNTWLIHVKNLAEGIALADAIAPEHCEVMLRDPVPAVTGITTAGAIFVGPYSPTVTGDYVAGPSHTLPTGGAGRCFAGLTVDQFQRRTSVIEYSRPALKRSLAAIEQFAGVEGLQAHLRSAAVRFEPAPGGRRRLGAPRSRPRRSA